MLIIRKWIFHSTKLCNKFLYRVVLFLQDNKYWGRSMFSQMWLGNIISWIVKLHYKIYIPELTGICLNHCLRKRESLLSSNNPYPRQSFSVSELKVLRVRRPTSGIHVRGQGHTVMTSRERERVGHSSPSPSRLATVHEYCCGVGGGGGGSSSRSISPHALKNFGQK